MPPAKRVSPSAVDALRSPSLMEHRLTRRVPVDLDVVADHEPALPVAGVARDLSLEGMFVEVDPEALDAQIGSALEIAFEVERGGRARACRSTAVVMHRQARGVGVMFATLDPAFLVAVEGVVRHARASEALIEPGAGRRVA